MQQAKSGSSRRLLVGVACILLAFAGIMVLLEAVLTPWARSLTGGPTLTGEWLGQMTTASSRRYWVWIRLEHRTPTSQCYNCPPIEGHARVCDVRGSMRDYELWGHVEDWRGSRFFVRTRTVVEASHELTLGTIEGRWEGNLIDLTTQLRVPGEPWTARLERDDSGNWTSAIVDGDPDTRAPVRWRMQRGAKSELDVRCGAPTLPPR